MAIQVRVKYVRTDGVECEEEHTVTEAEIATGRLAPLSADIKRVLAMTVSRVDDPAPS